MEKIIDELRVMMDLHRSWVRMGLSKSIQYGKDADEYEKAILILTEALQPTK